ARMQKLKVACVKQGVHGQRIAAGSRGSVLQHRPQLGVSPARRLTTRAYSSRLRAVVLLNHRSRGGGRPPLSRVLHAFQKADWDPEVWAGEGSGRTREATRRAVSSGMAAVFGAEGAGVLVTILPSLVGTQTALGGVPLGHCNVQ